MTKDESAGSTERIFAAHRDPDLGAMWREEGSRGRGIDCIFAACRKAETPKPSLRFDAGGIWTEFAFAPNYLKAISTPVTAIENNNLGRGEKRGEKLTPNRRKILEAMRADPYVTYKALIELVGIGATNIDKNIRALKEAGLIRRIGPAKGGRWEVIL
jgi:ATP-dependent DNA helicase RecG